MIIWANLDCEARWGGGVLPQTVARRVSAASALLAVLAPEGQPVEIYAPAAIDSDRIKLPNVTMRTGNPAHWDLAWADPNAKAANDRRVALALGEQLEIGLRGARAVTSLDELDAHLAALRPTRWVCKAPWTAAGRDRAHGEGSTLSGELRVYVGRLLERFGALLFEPWLDRVLDVGVCAQLGRDGDVTAQAPHTLLSDARGSFLGIDLAEPQLHDNDRELLARTIDAAGSALHCLGYAGPFTVDAFVYRDDDSHVLHPL
ncbi:MAG TPA: hypothetical protein VIV11_41835, partial [Kofleriaceae bacterium]